MLLYTRSFSSLIKPLLRILIKFWSSAEETIRVTAFLNILHIATHTINKEFVIEKLLKVRSICYDKKNIYGYCLYHIVLLKNFLF